MAEAPDEVRKWMRRSRTWKAIAKVNGDLAREREAEIEFLRGCLAVAAPPEGGPVVAIPVSTLEMLTNNLETAEKDSVEAVIAYIYTLNDLYHWNEWLCERLEQRFLD